MAVDNRSVSAGRGEPCVVFLAWHGQSASAPRGLLTAAQFGDYLRG
jgi:hypothetical protein